MGVWIETDLTESDKADLYVTPRVGVWIETDLEGIRRGAAKVTPRVGVWIETGIYNSDGDLYWSLPAWECGLKPIIIEVAGYVRSHSPRGSVD